MESTMGQARSTISKIFCGEPRTYTRFNLTDNMEGGDSSQVEMKLSAEADEEAPGCAAEARGQNTYSRQPRRPPKNTVFVLVGVCLVFIVGFLIGYLTSPGQESDSNGCDFHTTTTEASPWEGPKMETVPALDWSDIRKLLQDRLLPDRFDKLLSDLSLDSHEAGSRGDEDLANRVIKAFKANDMSPWTDQHYVKIQILPSESFNKVWFGEEVIGITRGYLSYSATGTQQGRVVYAHYGKQDDFKLVAEKQIDLTGAVVLLRAGKISFAEKVANAAKQKAAAVLIYPDPADYSFAPNIELYGHVHLGSGDPYTPGFPSFNHTQFPPIQSSGLPKILAQTITANMAAQIFKKMGGVDAPSSWSEGHLSGVSTYKLGGENDTVKVEVKNVLVERSIHNVFGVIEGFVDSDRYIVIGAQRDSWGPGYAKSTVGTSMLLELASAITDMKKHGGFRPRRSIVFASWSAGEYGSVGATEWLEGYLTSLGLKAFTYINLDAAITGQETFKVAASPLLYSLVQDTMKEMRSPIGERSLREQVPGTEWMTAMQMEDSAYPFLAFTGIPSISFGFRGSGEYPYLGTAMDSKINLDSATAGGTARLAASAAQFAGQVALRLVHDHLLKLDVEHYVPHFRSLVAKINFAVHKLKGSGVLSGAQAQALSVQWLKSAVGSYSRASSDLARDITNSDLSDAEMCRTLNDRIMRVESSLLSPYVSPKDAPFRHILFGSGGHTMQALVDHLNAIRAGAPDSDADLFRNQFALATWTIQSCANSLEGDVWAMNNDV